MIVIVLILVVHVADSSLLSSSILHSWTSVSFLSSAAQEESKYFVSHNQVTDLILQREKKQINELQKNVFPEYFLPFFLLGFTGGRPANWTNISEECLSMLNTFTADMNSLMEYQTHQRQQSSEPWMYTRTPTNRSLGKLP